MSGLATRIANKHHVAKDRTKCVCKWEIPQAGDGHPSAAAHAAHVAAETEKALLERASAPQRDEVAKALFGRYCNHFPGWDEQWEEMCAEFDGKGTTVTEQWRRMADTVLDLATPTAPTREAIAAVVFDAMLHKGGHLSVDERAAQSVHELLTGRPTVAEVRAQAGIEGPLIGSCARCGAKVVLPADDPTNDNMEVCGNCAYTVAQENTKDRVTALAQFLMTADLSVSLEVLDILATGELDAAEQLTRDRA